MVETTDDGDGHIVTVTFTEIASTAETLSTPQVLPVAEAIVYGVDSISMVETVTLEDGSFVLNGLRNGFAKVFAARSDETDLSGIAEPAVYGDLSADQAHDF